MAAFVAFSLEKSGIVAPKKLLNQVLRLARAALGVYRFEDGNNVFEQIHGGGRPGPMTRVLAIRRPAARVEELKHLQLTRQPRPSARYKLWVIQEVLWQKFSVS
ncbi:hypothetical protein F52700_6084 [Fusarium sp. NRRL 52700]|nr:hypothetical protein F52700_6084 [Fusarium sp. NRRL 52700]